MPIFEYECAKCKNVFEVLCSAESSEKIRCPKCSSGRVKKLLSSFSVGSGRPGGGAAESSSACTSCATRNCSTCG